MGVSFDGDHDFGGRRVLEDDHLELRFGRSPRASTTLPGSGTSRLRHHVTSRLLTLQTSQLRFLGRLEQHGRRGQQLPVHLRRGQPLRHRLAVSFPCPHR